MRLVACPSCHAQFDISSVDEPAIACACGTRISTETPVAVDAEIRRCGACGAALERNAPRCAYCGSVPELDPAKLSLICPECYARNPDEGRFCMACGVAFRPRPLPGSVETLACPACASSMAGVDIGGVAVDECPACHGLWVAGADFDALITRAVEAGSSRPSVGLGSTGGGSTRPDRATGAGDPGAPSGEAWSVRYRRCPVCRGMMQRKNFGRRSGVIVDWCGRHGTWLDADELEAIATFIHGGGLAAPPDTSGDALARARGVWGAEFASMVEAGRPSGHDRTGESGPWILRRSSGTPFTLSGLLKHLLGG